MRAPRPIAVATSLLSALAVAGCSAVGSDRTASPSPSATAAPETSPAVPSEPAPSPSTRPSPSRTPGPGETPGRQPDGGDDPDAPAGAPADGEQVSVVIAFATWNAEARAAEVTGYVDGRIESGGTCTVRLERDGRVVTESVPAVPDATTTACGALTVAGDRLDAGPWEATLDYESPTSSGTSLPVTIDIP